MADTYREELVVWLKQMAADQMFHPADSDQLVSTAEGHLAIPPLDLCLRREISVAPIVSLSCSVLKRFCRAAAIALSSS